MPVSKNRRKNKKKNSSRSQDRSTRSNLIDFQSWNAKKSPTKLSRHEEKALNSACNLTDLAWESDSIYMKVKIAKEALEISDKCVAAYGLLAKFDSSDMFESEAYFKQAIQVSEEILDPADYSDPEMEFHDYPPAWLDYMFVRFDLCVLLWSLGEREEALGLATGSLEINPCDDLGIRYILISWLLELQYPIDSPEFTKHLRSFLALCEEEKNTVICYTRALVAYRLEGNSVYARNQLEIAKKINRFVPKLMLGLRFRIPKIDSKNYSLYSDAVAYVAVDLNNWQATEYSMMWMAENTLDIEMMQSKLFKV